MALSEAITIHNLHRGEQPVKVCSCTSKLPCVFQLSSSLLQVADAALRMLRSSTKVRKILKCITLIYGIWPQATDIHMRLCNAVPLVGRLLRLAPISTQLWCTATKISVRGIKVPSFTENFGPSVE